MIAGVEPPVAAEFAIAAVAYGWASTRVARWEARRTVAFLAGLAAIAVALGPLDGAAEGSLPGHMVQHLVLIFVAPPLLLAGAPLRLALATLPTDTGRALARFGRGRFVGALSHPAVALACFAAVLLGTHVPGFYEAAVRHPLLHAGEHVLYLLAGLVLWAPVLAPAPLPRRLSPLGSILYLLLAMFPGAVIGLALMTATGAVYPIYGATAAALDEQWRAGMVMWASGSAVLALAIVGLGWRALVLEERRQRIRDAHAHRADPTIDLPGAPR
jgi:cytochrome c oxidase assembly factor CtaG